MIARVLLLCLVIVVVVCGKSQYDKSTVTFSDKGELLQVEYALNAGLKGSSLLGLKCEGDVILCAPSAAEGTDVLLDRRSIDKVSKVDDKTWIAFSGLAGDGRYITKSIRSFSIQFYSKFGCSPDCSTIARQIGEMQHEATITRGATVIVIVSIKKTKYFTAVHTFYHFKHKQASVPLVCKSYLWGLRKRSKGSVFIALIPRARLPHGKQRQLVNTHRSTSDRWRADSRMVQVVLPKKKYYPSWKLLVNTVQTVQTVESKSAETTTTIDFTRMQYRGLEREHTLCRPLTLYQACGKPVSSSRTQV